MGIRSRFARWLPPMITLAGYAYAAAPDFGVQRLQTVWGLAGLIALWLLGQYVTQVVNGSELLAYGNAFKQVGDIISGLAADPEGAGSPQLFTDPTRAVDALLRRAQEIAAASLRPHADCVITAHLLLPEWKQRRNGRVVVGLRATYHDDYRPDRSHQLIALDSPGAGMAFTNGELSAVRNTDEHKDVRMKGRPYKSIGAFPIIVGTRGEGGRVRAVLTLDATVPFVFNEKSVRNLAPFVNPIAQLIGLALVTQDRRPTP